MTNENMEGFNNYVNDDEQTLLLPTVRPTRRYFPLQRIFKGLGTGLCLAIQVGAWAIMAETLQDLGDTYKQFFFQTYWIRSLSGVLYVAWKIWLLFPGKLSCNKTGEGSLTNFRKLFLTSGFMAAGTFISTVLWYFSLNHMLVSANTAIYQSTPVVAFILSVPMLQERVTIFKITSVILTVVGVFLISFFNCHMHGDSTEVSNMTKIELTGGVEDMDLDSGGGRHKDTPLGYVMVMISMIVYASTQVVFKKFGTSSDDTAPIWNGVRVLGYSGVQVLLLFWPLLIIAHFTGIEKFRFPTVREFKLLIGMTAFDIVYFAATFVFIALSTPLFVAVASVLVLPATVFWDWTMKNEVMPWQGFLGIGAILIGFLAFVLSQCWEEKMKSEKYKSMNTFLSSSHPQVNINKPLASKLQVLMKYII